MIFKPSSSIGFDERWNPMPKPAEMERILRFNQGRAEEP